jgi:hypothetical protein
MAILHFSRARHGRDVLQSCLAPACTARVPNSALRIAADNRSMQCARVPDLDPGSPARASRAGVRGQATQARRAQQFQDEERRVLSAMRSNLGPCPCDRCPHAAICCDLHLACRAFGQFVRGVHWRGTVRKPTHARYLRVFASEG